MKTSSVYKTADGQKTVMKIYDTALESWPVPYETKRIPTRHGDTFVISSGDPLSPAMILLHGAGGNSTMWAGDVERFICRFRVHAVDLIGEAGKSDPNRPPWDSPAFAEWLEDVFDGLKIEHGSLVGISQGAWVALQFAVSEPDRIDKLVLVSPGGIVPDKPLFLFRAIFLMMLGKWGIKRMVNALFGDQEVPEGVQDIVIQITNQFKPRVGLLPNLSDKDLQRLTMPTLLLGGTKDIIRDLDKIAARLRDYLPNLTVKITPGGGHALLNTGEDIMAFTA